MKGTSEHRGRGGTPGGARRQNRATGSYRYCMYNRLNFHCTQVLKSLPELINFGGRLNLSVEKGIIVSWPKSEIPVFPATSTCNLRPPLTRLTSSVVCFLF